MMATLMHYAPWKDKIMMDIANNLAHLVAWHIDAIRDDDDLLNMRKRLEAMEGALLSDNPLASLHDVIDEEYKDA